MNTSDSNVLIPLTQGQFAIVDAIDAEWIRQNKWCAFRHRSGTFYAKRHIKQESGGQRILLLHREIMTKILDRSLEKCEVVDHINRNPLDNRRSNLRVVTIAQNAQNHGISKRNTSTVTGVYWNKKSKTWHVQICFNRNHIHVGCFKSFEEAIQARKEAEKQYHIGTSFQN